MNLFDEIPELRQAVEDEKLNWNSAFLPVTETIGDFEAVPMTMRQYLLLRLMGSPLLGHQLPDPAELAAFLWVISPAFQPGKPRPRWFLKKCRRFVPPVKPWFQTRVAMELWRLKTEAAMAVAASTIDACRRYVDLTFMDRPSGGSTATKEYYCDAAFICAHFARMFGWDDELTLDKSLKRIFQYLKESRHHENPSAPLFKRSDRFISSYLERKNREANSKPETN